MIAGVSFFEWREGGLVCGASALVGVVREGRTELAAGVNLHRLTADG
jgi:hypothetical protein